MSEQPHRVEGPAEVVQHPVESAKALAVEAERGRSARTPALAISGVTLAVAVLVAAVLLVAVIAYVLA